MANKITKATVNRLEAGEKAYVHWDGELKGFGVWVSKSGRKHYLVKYRVNRRQRWYKLGPVSTLTPAQARDLARKALGRAAAGHDPASERDEQKAAMSMDELADHYITRHAEVKKKPKSVAEDQRLLDKVDSTCSR